MKTQEETCSGCGKKFISRIDDFIEQTHEDNCKLLCLECSALRRKQAEEERDRKEKEIRRKQAEAEHREFLERLKAWSVVSIDDIRPENDDTLYVIGNGFDLMHRVPSSYYHFRDTLGRHSTLRYMCEQFITVDDMWADLENALAHFNVSAMTSETVVDMWLDNFGVYDEDSGAAEFFMAIEAAATPIYTVANELPRRFGKWVNTLTVGTADRPLKNMFVNGKVLNFNYTEFVQDMYGVSKENICYIHGCRVKEKGKPREPLILGHIAGASDSSFEFNAPSKSYLRGFKRAFVEMTQSNIIHYISEYDGYLTKDTKKIIESHESFFEGLSDIQTVIAVGHSFAKTDSDYFFKIRSCVKSNAKWYFGCYGLRDLVNLGNLLPKMQLDKSRVAVFRTDTISTTPLPIPPKPSEKKKTFKWQCKTKDGKWSVEKVNDKLIFKDLTTDINNYEISLPNGFKRAFFACNDRCLLVVMYGLDPGVLLFRKTGEHWGFVGELYCDHQHLLVSRLQHVIVREGDITFVYNNRIRKYSLIDGSCISNKHARNARNFCFKGEEITEKFSRN